VQIPENNPAVGGQKHPYFTIYQNLICEFGGHRYAVLKKRKKSHPYGTFETNFRLLLASAKKLALFIHLRAQKMVRFTVQHFPDHTGCDFANCWHERIGSMQLFKRSNRFNTSDILSC
jgi:hypothetical protein